jgi:pimeloyl-ACP methyl ester carboxylesterase
LHISAPPGGIEPFYFGMSTKPLFGCYHAPRSSPARDCGVVLCYPMGQEYINSHRAIHQLAVRLSTEGFASLRFDFYGCGDSSGDCEQGQIDQWLTDLSTAVDEIRKRSGFEKICLVGLRLGGTLAAIAGAQSGDIDGMVLWDAVIDGRPYVRELLAFAKLKHRITGESHTEIAGFPLTHSMYTDLEHIDLLTIQNKLANNILLIESREEAAEERFQRHLKSVGTHIAHRYLPGPQIWREEPDRAIVPVQVLQTVVSWLSEVYP